MRVRSQALAVLASFVCSLASGCWLVAEPEHEDDGPRVPSQPLPLEGSPTALGMLRVVNELSFADLDHEVGLDRQAATSIVAYRSGPDARLGTADDRYVDDLAQLDALYWLGPENLWRIQAFALAEGWVPEALPESCEPALAQALDRCRAFVADAVASTGDATAAAASWSCVEADAAETSAADYFAQAGLVAYREPALGYHAMLCGDDGDAPLCELGVAGLAEHALPECVADGV